MLKVVWYYDTHFIVNYTEVIPMPCSRNIISVCVSISAAPCCKGWFNLGDFFFFFFATKFLKYAVNSTHKSFIFKIQSWRNQMDFLFFLDIIRHHIGAGTACNLSSSTAGDAVKEPLNHPVCKYRSLKWETGSYIECVFGVLTNRNSKTRQR